jgi:hypothetical protein
MARGGWLRPRLPGLGSVRTSAMQHGDWRTLEDVGTQLKKHSLQRLMDT